jgi:hypothetical protein
VAIIWQHLEMPSAGDVPTLEHELWFLPVQYSSLPTAKTQKTELDRVGSVWKKTEFGHAICFLTILKLLTRSQRFNNVERKFHMWVSSRASSIHLQPSQHFQGPS